MPQTTQRVTLPFRIQESLQRARTKIIPFDEILRCLPVQGRMLDVGCGKGALSFRFKQAFPELAIDGFDVNGAAIEQAIRHREDRKQQTGETHWDNLRFMSYAEFEKQGGEYDVILFVDVLHHVPPASQKQFVQSFIPRLKRGGRIIYKDMCTRPRWRAYANQFHDLVMARQWIHHVPVERSRSWFEEAGLRLVSESSHAILWYGHDLMVFEYPKTLSC